MSRIGATTLNTWLPPEGEELCRHTLAVAFRFVDPFDTTSTPPPLFARPAIPDPMLVTIDDLEWTAHAAADRTYRFLVSNADPDIDWHAAVVFGDPRPPRFPAIPVPLEVTVAPRDPNTARYFVPSPIDLTLPIPAPPANATPADRLAAYLIEVEAFPTPLYRAPAGQTTIRGVIRDNAGVPRPGVEVAVFPDATLPASAIFTRTTDTGFFACRLPQLKRPTTAPAEPSLGIAVRPIGGPAFATIDVEPYPGADTTRVLFDHGKTTSARIRAF